MAEGGPHLKGTAKEAIITVVARTFQREAGGENAFDEEQFGHRLNAFKRALEGGEGRIRLITAVPRGGCSFAEVADSHGDTPSMRAIKTLMADEVKDGRVVVLPVDDWGPNQGSPQALNLGWQEAEAFGSKYVLNWSPDMESCGEDALYAYQCAEEHGLHMTGGARQGWCLSLTTEFPQNTWNLTLVSKLKEIGGYDLRTAGGDGVTVPIILPNGKPDEAPRAGMEDAKAMSTLLKTMLDGGEEFRWGMIFTGMNRQKPWKVPYDPKSDAYKKHQEKMARQLGVTREWFEMDFPGVPFYQAIDWLFACRILLP